jgi:Na+/serine symporter
MALRKPGLVPQILIGVALGAATGLLLSGPAERLGLLGSLFVGMLKAVAPLLVMVLVMSALANRHESGMDGRKTLLTFALYVVGTVSAALLTGNLIGCLSWAVLLVAAMLVMALVVNPLIVFAVNRTNPYPIVFRCLEESGITAFFTRSSAANIPVNLALSKRLGISEELYSVTIPVGATVSMAGAAITITVLTLAATHTLGISYDVSMQVVAVGFIISVVQDSFETALNSSTDVVYTYAVDRSAGWPSGRAAC